MRGRKEDGRAGREGEGDEERGCRERDGRRGQGAWTRRREENGDAGTAQRWGRIRPGTGAGKSRGGGRTGGRWGGSGAERGWGRGRGLAGGGAGARVTARRAGEGRGGGAGPRRRISLPPRGGCVGGGAPAAATAAADGPTDGRVLANRRPAGRPKLLAGRETAVADDARPQAPRGRALPRGLTAPDGAPGPGKGARAARRSVPAAARPVRPHPPGRRPLLGGGGGDGAGGFVLSRRQWGRGGLGLRDEDERERERGGRAWGSLCACVIESDVWRRECAGGVGRVCVCSSECECERECIA